MRLWRRKEGGDNDTQRITVAWWNISVELLRRLEVALKYVDVDVTITYQLMRFLIIHLTSATIDQVSDIKISKYLPGLMQTNLKLKYSVRNRCPIRWIDLFRVRQIGSHN